MYNVIAIDEKEYGPVTSDFVRKWISNGRLNAQSRVRLEGASEWVALSTLPEFGLAFATLPPPPPVVSTVAPVKVSALAISSLVLGVLGVCGVTALAGLICGIAALPRVKRSEGRLSGRGLAIGGISVSAVFLLLLGVFAFGVVLPAAAKNRQQMRINQCRSNVRQLTRAVMMYARDNGGKFPAADAWCEAVQKEGVDPEVFLCPFGDPAKRCHYAYNARLDGAELAKIQNPATLVVIFETEGGWNVSGGYDKALKVLRHGRIFVGFADGIVRPVWRAALLQRRWDP